MQIFENKKEITTIIKELRTCFDKINQQFMLWILETTKPKNKKTNKQKKTKKHTYIITIREALRKEKGNQKQHLAQSTSSSWEDVLGFKETYSIIFET